MATQTKYLRLTKPAGTEPVNIDVLNNNFDKIDAGVLKTVRGMAAYNLLDNSNFVIAQAGYGGNHGNARYACDRWKNVYEYGTFEKVTDGLKASFSTNHCYMTQYLPDDVIAHLHGRVYTLAICLSGGVVIVRSRTFNSGTTSLHENYDNLVIEVLKNGVQIVVTSDSATICWVALYEGAYTADTLPDYVPKGYAAELAECQRYFERMGSPSAGSYGSSILLAVSSYGELRVLQGYKQTKRILPTIIVNGAIIGQEVTSRATATNIKATGTLNIWNNVYLDRLNTVNINGATTIAGTMYEACIDICADL